MMDSLKNELKELKESISIKNNEKLTKFIDIIISYSEGEKIAETDLILLLRIISDKYRDHDFKYEPMYKEKMILDAICALNMCVKMLEKVEDHRLLSEVKIKIDPYIGTHFINGWSLYNKEINKFSIDSLVYVKSYLLMYLNIFEMDNKDLSFKNEVLHKLDSVKEDKSIDMYVDRKIKLADLINQWFNKLNFLSSVYSL